MLKDIQNRGVVDSIRNEVELDEYIQNEKIN